MAYTFTPTDPEPVYEEEKSFVVQVCRGSGKSGRVDFTMREVLKSMKNAPTSK